ncbi:MAG TPA: hypothetical protein VLY24_04840 [Bryobacteraceae bacterium]|nr:hypothetical protein [Bryobacteraceae bacterium]
MGHAACLLLLLPLWSAGDFAQELKDSICLNVRALAIDPRQPSIVYAGTLERGLLRSDDGGASWKPFDPGLQSRSIYAMAFMDGAISVVTDVGDFQISDGKAGRLDREHSRLRERLEIQRFNPEFGQRYPRVLAGGAVVNSQTVDPFNPDTVYAATDRGVFKKAGQGWVGVNSGLPGSRIYAVAAATAKPGTFYALTSLGIFQTTDRAASWSALGSSRPPAFVESLAIDPATPGTLYAGTNHGVFKSTDAGSSWAPVNRGFEAPAALALAVDPARPATVYVGTDGCGAFKSTDGGLSWAAVNSGLTGKVVGTLAIDPANPATVYLGTGVKLRMGQGVFRSLDGGAAWLSASKGLPDSFGTNIFAMAVADSSPPAVYVSSFDLFRSVDGGGRWINISTTDARILTYTSAKHRFSSNVHSLAVDPANPNIQFAGAEGEIYKTVDGGANWRAVRVGTNNVWIEALAIDPAEPATLFAVTGATPEELPGGTILKSLDGGTTWSVSNRGLENVRFTALAIDPADPLTAYAGSIGSGLFQTADGGANWSSNTGLQGQNIFAIAVARTNPTEVYVGTSNGLFKSRDGGTSWAALSESLAAAMGLGR